MANQQAFHVITYHSDWCPKMRKMEAIGMNIRDKDGRIHTELPTFGTEEEEIFSNLGFELGPSFEGRPLWRPATLPRGWSIKTVHKHERAIVDQEERTIFKILAPTHRCVYMVIA